MKNSMIIRRSYRIAPNASCILKNIKSDLSYFSVLLITFLACLSCTRKALNLSETKQTTIASNKTDFTTMDEANYPLPTPGYYWIIGTNAANNKVEVYEPGATDWNAASALKWSFAPTTALGWTASQIALWHTPNEVRYRNVPALGGNCIATAGNRLALIAAYPTGEKIWTLGLNENSNPQSVEILPNGNFAVAAYGGNWIRVYASSQGGNDSTFGQFDLNHPHAVIWDPVNNLLWVTGQIPEGPATDVITALSVGGTDAHPVLTEVLSHRTAVVSSPARDIEAFLGDPNKFWVPCENGLYIFNKTTKTFTAAPGPANQTEISTVGSQPFGQIIVTKKDGASCDGSCWATSSISFYSTTALSATRTKTGARFMRMHPFNPNYEYKPEYNIATYNLRYYNTIDTGTRAWSYRYPLIIDMVKKYDFDIFGTQEGNESQITDLERLGAYSHFGKSVTTSNSGPHDAEIFYKRCRYNLEQSGNFWLSPGGPSTPTGPSWDASQKRVCTWGKFKDLFSGLEFYVFNTHFDNTGVTARAESANLILSKITSIAGSMPSIFMGDLNTNQTTAPYATLENSSLLEDAYLSAATSYSTRSTYNGFNPNVVGSSRLDHIFLSSQWTVKSHNILTDTYFSPSQVLPSDHFPVVIEVKH